MKRRDFLKSAAAGAGLVIVPRWARGAAPSDTVVLGCIGVRNIGNAHIKWFLGHKDCRIDAVCDIDPGILGRGLKRVHKKYGNDSAKGYGDFRKLLEREDIDAVTYGSPDHWHGLMATHAFAAGKDVYGEKPMTWCYREAKAMLDLCTEKKRIFQLGCQRHAKGSMRRSAEILKSGALGKIHTVRCWKSVRSPNHTTPDSKPPEGVDYDMWLGPAPKRPFNKHRFHYDFRFYWDYSGGDYVNWWCHVNDLPQWGVGFPAPKTVFGRGEDIAKGNAEAMRWIDVDVDYGEFKYYWTTKAPKHPCVTNGGTGMLFEGTKGVMGADFGKRKIQMAGSKDIVGDLPDVPKTLPGSGNWQGEFLKGVKTREQPSANIQYSFDMSVAMFLGRVAMQLGQKEGRTLTWDAEKEICVGDEEATRRLGRVMREPWKLPV
jgi:predicted dehydrogenase